MGLAALCGGAARVTQVDSSKAALSWAKKNLELNSGNRGEMKFIPEDALTFVAREERRQENKYDLIIVDPPSFGRSKKGTFSFVDDISDLLKSCLSVLNPNSHLLLTTNKRDLEPEDVLHLLNEASKTVQRKVTAHETILPPKDDFRSVGRSSVAMRGVLALIS